ncbi:hypothetical protein V5O48_012793 [Marasmius crinis-equi]|uniref:Uncharacterized protein n=1 Tax=Marasmius crinis-equi TaxID=585013 RepID=A0ABR3F1W5_9AGAR
MPRKKLYHNREQRRLANNAKAKRWRDKNVDFLRTQREERKREEEELRAQELRDKRLRAMKRKKEKDSKHHDEAKELEIDANLIRPHLLKAERLYEDFRHKIPNDVDYLEKLYQKYTTPQTYGTQKSYRHHTYLQDRSKTLNTLHETLVKASHSILQVAGPWAEWRKVECMVAEVRELVAWIEDMWCFAVLGLSDLRDAYQTRALRFRQVYKS